MNGEFVFDEDPERGIWKVGSFTEDGRLHVKVCQRIPDSFLSDVKAMREQFANRKRGTQQHWQPLPVIPHALADQLFRDGNGQMLAMNDPERDKIWKRLQNDVEYRDLRIWEGKA